MSGGNTPTIPALIAQHSGELSDLCHRYLVRRLELFGSATGEQFDPIASDLDFLVEFDMTADVDSWLSIYFSFRDALEALFGRSVDLVSFRAVENPHVRSSIEQQRVLVYAA
ncbi:MAG TPA: nucleotidyltransferase domain-containing protein [Thermomicrobiales bacterium]|jgi:predicted nucleotidyltransferase|nr:nucleotidyltransferase domain-containing protein [Thermomicrobiales bacterium]